MKSAGIVESSDGTTSIQINGMDSATLIGVFMVLERNGGLESWGPKPMSRSQCVVLISSLDGIAAHPIGQTIIAMRKNGE